MARYRNLTDQETGWAKNLRAIFDRRKEETGISQQKLADIMGVSQSAVTQYINAVIPLGLSAKISFALALKCNLAEIDPEINFYPTPSEEEQALIEAYRHANQKGKKLLLEVAEVSASYHADKEPND